MSTARALLPGILCVASLGLVAASSPAQEARRWAAARSFMVESEVAAAGVKQPAILAVMRTVPRHEFVPADVRSYAYLDMALPIGEHQTISPPFVVAWMTAQLDPRPTDRVLEIGTGSGYQAAVLSGLVKHVYTIEIVKPLAERAKQTFARLGYENIDLKVGDGYEGWPENAPFDKIIVTCSPEAVPRALVDQLREGGRMVIPLGERFQQTIFVMARRDGKLVVESREPTFFVPMTGQAEALRRTQASGPVTPLVNGDFEQSLDVLSGAAASGDAASGGARPTEDKPAGWYYLRQAAIRAGSPQTASQRYMTFTNRVPGRSSQVLQAIGVDGRRVKSLAVELWVSARDVAAGPADERGGRVLISFLDENRAPAGQQELGPWTGSFNWQRRSGRLKVPPEARVAIVAVGLLGATGELACDEVDVRAADLRAPGR